MSRERYVYRPGHPRASERGFVNVNDLGDFGDGERAVDAPIMVDRFYEGASTTTVNEKGERVVVDIGSRKKHRTFMKDRGLTTIDDYKDQWARQAKERREGTPQERKQVREDVARALHDVINGRGAKRRDA